MKSYVKSFLLGCIVTIFLWAIIGPTRNYNAEFLQDIFNSNSEDQKILHIGRAHDSLGLDPATETDQESFRVTVNIYDTLVKHSSDGRTILPSLATKWDADESGQVWTFDIRDDVEFHDGSALDAHDIKFNFERWMDKDNPYHAGNFNYWAINFDGFPGIVDQVNVLSDYKLEIVLNRPFAPFLSALTQPAFGIASPDAIKTFNDSLDTHPIGTGPFIFSKWEDHTITLRRNENYWGQVANVHGVVFETIEDSSVRLEKLKSGQLHIADLNYLETIDREFLTSGLRIATRPSFNIGYLALNMNNDYLENKDVRRAIAHAFDRRLMMDRAFNETSKNANTFVPPVLWGHNESLLAPKYDIEEALMLLEPYAGQEIKLDLLVMDTPRNYFPAPIKLGNFIKESLEPLGITADVRIETWKEVIRLKTEGDYDMVLTGWNGDIIDPDNFLFTLFSSNNIGSELSTNYSNYSNPNVDKLLVQARQVLDQDFRTALYRELQEIIQEDMPAIPLAHTTPITVTQGLIGFEPYLSGGDALNYLDLEVDLE
ncbi:ABC transporter substrate-binding protein [Acidaminobacter sp. JC074]|uniref:ABC transporter substrate-binding protein n=1 Tax=Acidaminobacter sp. JC074 TaxID=2530199 RepID=UPI001F0E887B|nr:ABC transporter substrate-binding protein [Acidaminobacter sp. JC074]MCH4890195.1 ABC transporter substrate-binding protein [Acidaminobacter sp. JC074]